MPNGNGRGPAGAGPMTGRGAGKCAGNATAGSQSAGGRRMGRGNRCGGRSPVNFRGNAQNTVASADAGMLQGKIDTLSSQLVSLQNQLAEISAKKED